MYLASCPMNSEGFLSACLPDCCRDIDNAGAYDYNGFIQVLRVPTQVLTLE